MIEVFEDNPAVYECLFGFTPISAFFFLWFSFYKIKILSSFKHLMNSRKCYEVVHNCKIKLV